MNTIPGLDDTIYANESTIPKVDKYPIQFSIQMCFKTNYFSDCKRFAYSIENSFIYCWAITQFKITLIKMYVCDSTKIKYLLIKSLN